MKTNKKDILSILLGNTLLALAVILFIVPGHLLSGGTTGISLFLNHYFHLPISLFTFILIFAEIIVVTALIPILKSPIAIIKTAIKAILPLS